MLHTLGTGFLAAVLPEGMGWSCEVRPRNGEVMVASAGEEGDKVVRGADETELLTMAVVAACSGLNTGDLWNWAGK